MLSVKNTLLKEGHVAAEYDMQNSARIDSKRCIFCTQWIPL